MRINTLSNKMQSHHHHHNHQDDADTIKKRNDHDDGQPPFKGVIPNVRRTNKKEPAQAFEDARSTQSNQTDKESQSQHFRSASFTFSERMILSALLLDKEDNDATTSSDLENASGRREKKLNEEMLFTLPCVKDNTPVWSDNIHADEDEKEEEKEEVVEEGEPLPGIHRLPLPPKTKRNQSLQIGLWRAHEEGKLRPKHLRQLSSGGSAVRSRLSSACSRSVRSRLSSACSKSEVDSRDEGALSIFSDEEVRGKKQDDDDDSASSWGLSEGGFDHYDTWGVLKDEYAQDFGFGYADGGTQLDDSDDEAIHFRILGTSVDDVASHPHVLSPPLMESILNFVPDTLSQQNFWMKFSLVRDGASLQTLRRYVRAAQYTVLAIETTEGDVFGCFTSSPWKLNGPRYFGNGEAFLWKMRHSRMTPCHSMLDQAELESEIDVYPFSGLNTYTQLCMRDKIAVGGGELDTSGQERHGDEIPPDEFLLEMGENYGFGLVINSDLLKGTSSPCATFRNPCLSKHDSKGNVFDIVNLEVWTFTPSESVDAAEKMELKKYFVQESVMSSFSTRSGRNGSVFSGEELSQKDFYRKVGEGDDSERYGSYGMEGAVVGIASSTVTSLLSSH